MTLSPDPNASTTTIAQQPLPPPLPNPRLHDHIFVSYAHADRATVERLADDLREHGHIVWIDFEDIQGGYIWRQAIVDGISASAVLLIVISPDSLKSEWVEIELTAARQFGKKIVPLLLRPMSTPEDKANHHRLGLEPIQFLDFTQGYELGLQALLKPDVLPRPASGVPGHCQKLIARLAALPWGLDHYIQGRAKLLPIDASPYEDGAIKGQPQRLLERLWQGERLLILGEPGMGKTVALERLAWELASSDPPILPVIVSLRNYDGQPLLEWIRLSLVEVREIRLRKVEEVKTFLENIPFNVYFLLDGLNEVRPVYRDAIEPAIIKLAIDFPAPKFRLVVTSRVQDDTWHRLQQTNAINQTFLVQQIQTEQAQTYLAAHLNANNGEVLWNKLDDNMRQLASTPLLLWLIKEAWRDQQQVPSNRGALYGAFVARMLCRDNDRGLGTAVSETQRLRALEKLALAMHTAQTVSLETAEAQKLIGDEATFTALKVNGLLNGEQSIRFSPHQTIQEHFAARAIEPKVIKMAGATGMVKLLRQAGISRGVLKFAADSWWAETFIQLAGLVNDANALAQAVAEVNPWLAWWCVEEGHNIDERTREIIQQKSAALVESRRVNDRRRAAQALARLQSPRVIELLVKLAMDVDKQVGRTAELALGTYGEAAKPYVLPQTSNIHNPIIRARIWRILDSIGGDSRPGVGLRADGLPDILWCDVPAGKFIYQDNERLTLPAFKIAKYPITYRQFQAFIDAPDGYRTPVWWKDLHPDGLKQQQGGLRDQAFKFWNHPRERVSWYEAIAFCRWLSAKLGMEITLPTEQQWEKAARGTDGREYPYGNDFDAGKGNTGNTKIGQTSAVGIFPDPNLPYGILDMSGNVREWTLTEYESGNSNDLTNNETRSVRGGSWDVALDYARAASRRDFTPGYRSSYTGFRLVGGRPPSAH